ncbi:unnamed protein product [Prorocentrum cordatum]|uniref:EF-hand domain-containing protein n=1 Tax=Prorocentrum cordatum TaxID=2364126 RepID=A0ABN9W9Q2_9DINO|nr:unnamed protein product [Polarella glacialis]
MGELRVFAVAAGFEGTAADWVAEYNRLCHDAQADPAFGLPLALFADLVDDRTERGCYCTDEELRLMLPTGLPRRVATASQASTPPAAEGRRAELAARLFGALDAGGRGLLDEEALLRFASRTGFHGRTREEWSEEYRLICQERGADPMAGVDLQTFQAIIRGFQ